jgi:hypothetical protein
VSLPADHPLLEQAAKILREHGLSVAARLLKGLSQPVLVVESPYLVAVLLASERWAEVRDDVYDAQVSLANWAGDLDTSSRRWDLYVVVLLEKRPEPEEGAQIERVEADTSLSRKVVRSGVLTADPERVRDALRPLLPLKPVGGRALPDLAEALKERLRVHGVEPEVVEQAVSGFLHGGKVWV